MDLPSAQSLMKSLVNAIVFSWLDDFGKYYFLNNGEGICLQTFCYLHVQNVADIFAGVSVEELSADTCSCRRNVMS